MMFHMIMEKASTKVFGDNFNRDNEPRRVAVSADMVLKEVDGNRLGKQNCKMVTMELFGISIYATGRSCTSDSCDKPG